MEDLRAMTSGVCTDEEKEKCRNEFGDNLEWACGKCEKNRAQDFDVYTAKLLRIRGMRMAGYPFEPDDLTPEEWEDLGKVEQWLLQIPVK